MKKTTLLAIALSVVTVGAYAGADVPSSYGGGDAKLAPELDAVRADAGMAVPYAKKTAAAPIKLDADRAEYDQETGNFVAEGNVVLRQNGQVLRTDYAEGNMKTGDVFLKQGGEMTEAETTMHAEWITYNFLKKTGEVRTIDGSNHDKFEWYTAPNAVIRDGKLICENGATVSRCPAKKHPPCLSVVAKHFEVIPNDKMIAKDCWVLVRGKRVVHRNRWINDLNDKHQTMIHPRIGYDSDTGMRYELDFNQALWKNALAGAEIAYYGHDHYKPNFWLRQDFNDFVVGLSDGWDDDDGDWYKKEMNWKVNLKRHRLVKGLPLSYSAYLEHGLWKRMYDEPRNGQKYSQRSWHTEYGVYLYHDPIHFFGSERNSLNLYVGKKWVREGLTDVHTSTNTYGATLSQKFGDLFTAWVGYYDEKVQDNRIFDIGQPDMAKEVRLGAKYVTHNRKNEFIGVYRLNTKRGKYEDYEYGHRYEYDLTWVHHFCCWDLVTSYEREFAKQDHSFKVKFEFSFM